MAEAEAEALAQIIRALHSPETSDSDRSRAIALLEEKENTPQTIIPCLLIVQSYSGIENTVIRQMAAVIIGHVIKRFMDTFSVEDLSRVKCLFLEAIRTEEVWLVRKNLCEAVVKAIDPKRGITTSELLAFARSCLETPALMSTGLYLILEMKMLIDASEMEEMGEFLVGTCMRAFQCEDVTTRIVAIDLIDAIIWHPGDTDKYAGAICEALFELLKRAFFVTKNPDECTALAKAVVELTTHPKEMYKQYSKPCTELAFELVANKDLEWQLRVIAYKILGDDSGTEGGIFLLLADDNVEKILEYLNVVIDLSLLICREDRSNPMFEFPTSFLHNAGATVEGDEIYRHIWTICNQIVEQGDLAARQEALFLLSCIVESQEEAFSDNVKEIAEFVFSVGGEMDEDLARYASRVLQEMAEYVPDAVTSIIDETAEFLLKRVHWVEPLITLDKVLDAASHPPRQFDSFMAALLELLTKGNAGMQSTVIDCMASCISNVYEPIEPVYPVLMPILTQALRNDLLKGSVIRCIGNLSGVAPLAMKADVPKLVELFCAAFATKDLQLCTISVQALEKIALNLPIELIPHLQALIQPLVALISENAELDNEAVRLLGYYRNFYCATLTCLATFFRAFPRELACLGPVFMNMLGHSSQIADKHLPHLCQAIALCADSMLKIDVRFDEYLFPIVEKLKNTMEKKHIIVIHRLIGDLMKVYGMDVLSDETNIEKIKTCLTNGIDCTSGEGYMMCELSSCVDIELLPDIFYSLKEFINALGPKVQEYANSIVPVLYYCFRNSWDLYKGYPIEIFAQICSFTGSVELYEQAFSHSVEFLTSTRNWCVLVCAMNALRLLICTSKEPFAADQEQIFQCVDQFVKSCLSCEIDYEPLKQASIALWTTMVMELGIDPPQDSLGAVLEALPPACDDEWIPVAAVFIVFAMTKWPDLAHPRFPYIAGAVLASSTWMMARIPAPIVATLKSNFAQIPESDWSQYVLHYQGRLLRLMENMRNPN